MPRRRRGRLRAGSRPSATVAAGQVSPTRVIEAFAGSRGHLDSEVAPAPHHVPGTLFFEEVAQLRGAAVHLVAGEPGWHRLVRGHVGDDLFGQLGFRRELDILGDAQRGPQVRVRELLGGHPDPGADQGVPTCSRIRAVHRVDPVRRPARRSPCTAVSPLPSRCRVSDGLTRPARRPSAPHRGPGARRRTRGPHRRPARCPTRHG